MSEGQFPMVGVETAGSASSMFGFVVSGSWSSNSRVGLLSSLLIGGWSGGGVGGCSVSGSVGRIGLLLRVGADIKSSVGEGELSCVVGRSKRLSSSMKTSLDTKILLVEGRKHLYAFAFSSKLKRRHFSERGSNLVLAGFGT